MKTVLELITGLFRPTPKPILSQWEGRQRGLAPRLTLAMKTLASNTALMCFSQPEFSRPSRKSDMEGERNSLTGIKTQLHQPRSTWGDGQHRQPTIHSPLWLQRADVVTVCRPWSHIWVRPAVGLPGAANVMEGLGFRSMFSLDLHLGNKAPHSHLNQGWCIEGLVLQFIVAFKEQKKTYKKKKSQYQVMNNLIEFNLIISAPRTWSCSTFIVTNLSVFRILWGWE